MYNYSYDFTQDTIFQNTLTERKWSWKPADNGLDIEICWETPSKSKYYFEIDRENFLTSISDATKNFNINEIFSLYFDSIGKPDFPATEDELLEDVKAIKAELTQLNKTLQVRDRCRDCPYLVEDKNGHWACDDCEKECEDIPNDECSANQDW